VRLITYSIHHQTRAGALINEKIVDLFSACQVYSRENAIGLLPNPAAVFLSIQEMLNAGPEALRAASTAVTYIRAELSTREEDLRTQGVLLDLGELDLLAPLPRPGKVICVGSNFPTPGKPAPEYPILFLKPSSTITGPDSPIYLPPVTSSVAYEVELAVIIGQRAKYLSVENALSCVAGYTLANDVGDRLLEKRTSQWTTGKLMDTFTPMGPALVTPDELPGLANLKMQTRINGEIVQQGNTSQMFFNIPFLVSYISSLSTLEPGDVILTGSPKMIAENPAPTLALKNGDEIEIEIECLGRLANPVRTELWQ
jgi:acylpyruvate hydrolase